MIRVAVSAWSSPWLHVHLKGLTFRLGAADPENIIWIDKLGSGYVSRETHRIALPPSAEVGTTDASCRTLCSVVHSRSPNANQYAPTGPRKLMWRMYPTYVDVIMKRWRRSFSDVHSSSETALWVRWQSGVR